jgi:hypothetical protein
MAASTSSYLLRNFMGDSASTTSSSSPSSSSGLSFLRGHKHSVEDPMSASVSSGSTSLSLGDFAALGLDTPASTTPTSYSVEELLEMWHKACACDVLDPMEFSSIAFALSKASPTNEELKTICLVICDSGLTLSKINKNDLESSELVAGLVKLVMSYPDEIRRKQLPFWWLFVSKWIPPFDNDSPALGKSCVQLLSSLIPFQFHGIFDDFHIMMLDCVCSFYDIKRGYVCLALPKIIDVVLRGEFFYDFLRTTILYRTTLPVDVAAITSIGRPAMIDDDDDDPAKDHHHFKFAYDVVAFMAEICPHIYPHFDFKLWRRLKQGKIQENEYLGSNESFFHFLIAGLTNCSFTCEERDGYVIGLKDYYPDIFAALPAEVRFLRGPLLCPIHDRYYIEKVNEMPLKHFVEMMMIENIPMEDLMAMFPDEMYELPNEMYKLP